MCPTNRTCKRDCFVVNDLIKIQRQARSNLASTTAARVDRVRRDSGKFKCPDGSFEMAAARIFKK